MLPKKLENFNVIVDGRPLAGIAEEITLPKFARKLESFRAGGMIGPVSLDLGIEELKLEFTLAEFNADILSGWGVPDASGIGVRFMGAMRADAVPMCEVSSPSAAIRRSRIPVRVRIHSSLVSTICSRSALVITRSGA